MKGKNFSGGSSDTTSLLEASWAETEGWAAMGELVVERGEVRLSGWSQQLGLVFTPASASMARAHDSS